MILDLRYKEIDIYTTGGDTDQPKTLGVPHRGEVCVSIRRACMCTHSGCPAGAFLRPSLLYIGLGLVTSLGALGAGPGGWRP